MAGGNQEPNVNSNTTNNKKVIDTIHDVNELPIIEAFKIYYKLGFNVIPVRKDKTTFVKKWSNYVNECIDERKIKNWARRIKKEDLNIAIITGFDNLVVYDCDSEEVYKKFKEAFKELFGADPESTTWVCKTGKGYHVYLKIAEDKGKDKVEKTPKFGGNRTILKDKKGNKLIELRRQFGGYVLVPPSIHPSGAKYTWIHDKNVKKILEVSKNDIITFEHKFRETRELTKEEIDKIIKWLEEKEYWAEGQRQLVLLALSFILRYFGKIKLSSVKQLYEEIRKKLGDDSRDYSQRIRAIELTYEKPITDVAYKTWLKEELNWETQQIEEFKFGLLKIIKRNVKNLYKHGFTWVYEIANKVLEKGFKTTYKELEVVNCKIIDRTTKYKNEEEIESRTKTLCSRKIEYIKGSITPQGTYVKLAIIEDDKNKQYIEGLLDDVLETLHRSFRVISSDGKEKLGQLFSFLAKFEDKTYNLPGIVLDGNKFVATVPGSEAFEYLFPETESQRRWVKRVKEISKTIDVEDFIKYLEAWLEYKNFLPNDVYYIVLGFTFIAPLLHSLVYLTDLKPGLYLIGPKKSGKTTLGKFICVLGFGSRQVGRTALETGFRFDEFFSTATIPVLVDDIERVSTGVVSRLKSMLTGDVESFRGQGSLKIREYKLIATPVITANHDALDVTSDPALMDRLIVINLNQRLTNEKVFEFSKKIKKLLVGNKTVAPYLIKSIIDAVNDLGGMDFFKKEFDKIYEELIIEVEDEGRAVEKATLIILGLKIANEVFKRNLGKTFDFNEAKTYIIKAFKEPLDITEFAPEELINLAVIIVKSRNSSDKIDVEFPLKEIRGKKYFVVTQQALTELSNDLRLKLPRKLSELRDILLSVFRNLDRDLVYRTIKLKDQEGREKATRVVLIEESLVYKLVGKETDTKEKGIEELIKKEVKESNAQGYERCSICTQIIEPEEKMIMYKGNYYHEKCFNEYVYPELVKEFEDNKQETVEENNIENMGNTEETNEETSQVNETVKEIIGQPKEVSEDKLDF